MSTVQESTETTNQTNDMNPPTEPGDRSGSRARLRRIPRPFVLRLVVGVLVVVGIAVTNPSFVGWGMAVTAALIAVPLSRFRAYALAFLPYGLVWLGFTLLRALADETPVPLRTEEVTRVERFLFFGATPTIWLQDRLFDPLHISFLDYLTTFTHWSYFIVPHLVAILIWRSRPELFQRFMITMTLTMGIGLVIYFLSPAAPPWLTADKAPQQDIYRVMANVGRTLNSSLYDRTYSVLGDPNAVAAMPSLHLAITFMLFLFALNYGRKIAAVALIYSLMMAFSLVYTGEHYVIDTLVGGAIATYAYLYSGRWLALTSAVFKRQGFMRFGMPDQRYRSPVVTGARDSPANGRVVDATSSANVADAA
jgi:hypothetical protein